MANPIRRGGNGDLLSMVRQVDLNSNLTIELAYDNLSSFDLRGGFPWDMLVTYAVM